MLFNSFRKEREQVLAHSELFIGTAWYRKVLPHQWCEAVGVRREDSPAYVDAIATNLAGKHPSAFTLAAIEKNSFKIASFVGRQRRHACGRTPEGGQPISAARSRQHVANCGSDPCQAGRMAMHRGQACSACRKSAGPKLLCASGFQASL